MHSNLVALRQSLGASSTIDKSMLRFVLDQSRDCIKILTAQGHIEYVNSEGQCALEVDNLASIVGKFWPDLWPERSRPAVHAAVNSAIIGDGSIFEASRNDKEGKLRWWQISVSPLEDHTGVLIGILTISRDITETVRLREAEQTLALEMKHRLRNAYTVASAIVTQSARGNEADRAFADSVTSRLADVAISQSRLLEAGAKSWNLAELIKVLVAAHGESASGVRYTGSSIDVDGHQAMLIALVVGELTNNSLKYGALRAGKTVSLTWTVADNFVIRWREPLLAPLGKPLGARDAGSGYSLMTRMAKSQRAAFDYSAEESEIVAVLKLPSPQKAN